MHLNLKKFGKHQQQVNIDLLYELEHFEIERSVGQDVNKLECKNRGVRNLVNIPAHVSRAIIADTIQFSSNKFI